MPGINRVEKTHDLCVEAKWSKALYLPQCLIVLQKCITIKLWLKAGSCINAESRIKAGGQDNLYYWYYSKFYGNWKWLGVIFSFYSHTPCNLSLHLKHRRDQFSDIYSNRHSTCTNNIVAHLLIIATSINNKPTDINVNKHISIISSFQIILHSDTYMHYI